MSSVRSHVAAVVVGAGPYGLSVACHLKGLGVSPRIFGQPMSFWRAMPESINLKSFAFATNVSVPRKHYTFPEYCRSRGLEDLEPCTMASFADYGVWVQQQLVPEVETTQVTEVSPAVGRRGGFDVCLETGASFTASAVVVATGLSHFARLPPVLAELPRRLATHTSEYSTFTEFSGKEVAVIGGGASAVETATILSESGARPLLLVRERILDFHDKFNPGRSWGERFRAPNSVLGPGRKSWVLQHFPLLIHALPERPRVRFTRNYLGPAGPWWLRDRFFGRVPTRLGVTVVRAAERGDRVELEIREAGGRSEVRSFDHVIAGTGFETDVDALPFLSRALRSRIRRVDGAPRLSSHFESSARGLYFVGPSAALSFGPLFRFVTGGAVAAPRVARHLRRRLGSG